MEKRELELPLELILKIASGRDSDGSSFRFCNRNRKGIK